ncbi:MAG: hypothetical protein CV087_16200 [Candidatus Brocadia sp. WS118]|nr:MAG: hypothetical protein CV087_16200 [Candidatus Brocadia sp. WS118]
MNEMPTFQEDYIKLLETLIKIADANKGVTLGEDNRFLDAEGLCKKFIGHAASALYLFESTTLPSVKVTDRGISFFDPGSINVLGRAALESFLVFHYVFIEPRSDDEKDFRYYLWLHASYLDRQKFLTRSEDGKKQLNDEKKIIDALKEKINNNSVFKQLDEKKKKKLVEKGQWRLQSWTDIGMSAGLSEILAKQFYSFLCIYAHSGCQSAQQVGNAETAETQKDLCVATMKLIMIVMANMIKVYCQMFVKPKDVRQKDEDAKKLIDQWVNIGTFLQNEF